MPKHFKKCIITYRFVMLLYIITSFIPQITPDTEIRNDEDEAAYKRAKNAFMERAREYIKQNPISPELQAFINRFKRSHTSTINAPSTRSKRDSFNDDNVNNQMYVMRDGNLLPFDPKRLKRQNFTDYTTPQMYKVNNDGEVVPVGHAMEQIGSELTPNFEMQSMTVVPLIIPIHLEHNVTVTTNYEERGGVTATGREGETEDSRQSDRTTADLLPHRRLPISRESGKKKNQGSNEDTTTSQEGWKKPEYAEEGSKKLNYADSRSDEDDHVDSHEGIDPMVGAKSATERARQVSMLNQVLADVEDLINRESGGRDYGSEGLACDLNGEWDSIAGGVIVNIMKNTSLCDETSTMIPVKITEKDPIAEGALRPANWNASAIIPFKKAALVVITGTTIKGKKVFSFIGECKICDGTEAIVGTWQIARASSDCKDQKAARSLHQDVLRKTSVSKLRQEHLKRITSTSRSSSTIV